MFVLMFLVLPESSPPFGLVRAADAAGSSRVTIWLLAGGCVHTRLALYMVLLTYSWWLTGSISPSRGEFFIPDIRHSPTQIGTDAECAQQRVQEKKNQVQW